MANVTKETATEGQSAAETSEVSESQGIGSPISNEAYNVITALQSKLEGLHAYRQYASDANRELWKRLTEFEMKAVSCLVDELEEIVKSGKLRVQEPGSAH